MSEPITIGATVVTVVVGMMVKDYIMSRAKKSNGIGKMCPLHAKLEESNKGLWKELGHMRADVAEIKECVGVLKDRSDRAISLGHAHTKEERK